MLGTGVWLGLGGGVVGGAGNGGMGGTGVVIVVMVGSRSCSRRGCFVECVVGGIVCCGSCSGRWRYWGKES